MPMKKMSLKIILCCLVVIFNGCALFKVQLGPDELFQRHKYIENEQLQMLLDVVLKKGRYVSAPLGIQRRVLELDYSKKGFINRKFFELQLIREDLYLVFFLENIGSVENTNIRKFPKNKKRRVEAFFQELEPRLQNEFVPIAIDQYKITKKMIVCEKEEKVEYRFSACVTDVEKNTLFGTLYLPQNSFQFFGMETEKVVSRDFLAADSRFMEYTKLFLDTYQKKKQSPSPTKTTKEKGI